ncbi:MAG: FtsW/RodA/SpoVE family cell cycle protein [Planctomycetaceae bacterium]|nr:rod shape-determining protein RodA [Planctomycetaceae bacterium]
MTAIIRRYLRLNIWPIIVAMVALMAIGIVAISVSDRTELAGKQAAFMVVGLVAFFVITLVPYPRFGKAAYALFGVTLPLLLMMLVPRLLKTDALNWLIPSINGARRWINFGPIMFQPSELAKLSFILMLAWYLRYGDHYRTLSGLIPPFILALVPMFLILKEPDLGTSLLLLPTLYFMLFMAGARLRHLLGIIAVATVLMLLPRPVDVSGLPAAEASDRQALSYANMKFQGRPYAVMPVMLSVMEPHQLRRIEGWLGQGDPDKAGDEGYQLRQSKMILSVGALFGGGGWNEINQFYRTLPERESDFIFAVIGGQWGIAGCLTVLLMYAVIFICGVEIAVGTHDPFGRLLAVGVAALMFSQVVVNIAVVIGLMPVTGMTLPLVSYGGTSLVINCSALGLLVNVAQRRPISLAPRPFEHGAKEGPEAPYGPMSTGEPERRSRNR